MSELAKLTKILTSVVREVVREELSFTKKEILSEIKSMGGGQIIREDYGLTNNNIPKLFNQFAPQSVPQPQRQPVHEQTSHKKIGLSALQELANQKLQNPDEEFLAIQRNAQQ